jgi:hypothetical protein
MMAHELLSSLLYIGLTLETGDGDAIEAARYCDDARKVLEAYLARCRSLRLGSKLNIEELLAPLGGRVR